MPSSHGKTDAATSITSEAHSDAAVRYETINAFDEKYSQAPVGSIWLLDPNGNGGSDTARVVSHVDGRTFHIMAVSSKGEGPVIFPGLLSDSGPLSVSSIPTSTPVILEVPVNRSRLGQLRRRWRRLRGRDVRETDASHAPTSSPPMHQPTFCDVKHGIPEFLMKTIRDDDVSLFWVENKPVGTFQVQGVSSRPGLDDYETLQSDVRDFISGWKGADPEQVAGNVATQMAEYQDKLDAAYAGPQTGLRIGFPRLITAGNSASIPSSNRYGRSMIQALSICPDFKAFNTSPAVREVLAASAWKGDDPSTWSYALTPRDRAARDLTGRLTAKELLKELTNPEVTTEDLVDRIMPLRDPDHPGEVIFNGLHFPWAREVPMPLTGPEEEPVAGPSH